MACPWCVLGVSCALSSSLSSLPTHRTAHHTTARLCYTPIRQPISQSTSIATAAAIPPSASSYKTQDHCCSPLRASQTRQSAQKLRTRTNPSHHPLLPPTLARSILGQRPISTKSPRQSALAPLGNPTLVDSISNRPHDSLPHHYYTHTLETLDFCLCLCDCASTRMSSSF